MMLQTSRTVVLMSMTPGMFREPVDGGFVLQLAKGSLSPQVRASICFWFRG